LVVAIIDPPLVTPPKTQKDKDVVAGRKPARYLGTIKPPSGNFVKKIQQTVDGKETTVVPERCGDVAKANRQMTSQTRRPTNRDPSRE
jgi:hypothetical protein